MGRRVRLRRPDGRRVWRYRLVMEEYLGRELKPTELVHHKNGDPSDDRLEDLELMTVGAHISLYQRGIPRPNHPSTKLTSRQVAVIRKAYRSGKYTQAQLAQHFGVSRAMVSHIVNGKRRNIGASVHRREDP
jgi:predicted DNA binding protein